MLNCVHKSGDFSRYGTAVERRPIILFKSSLSRLDSRAHSGKKHFFSNASVKLGKPIA